MFLKISNQRGKESFDNEKKNDRKKKKSILNLEWDEQSWDGTVKS